MKIILYIRATLLLFLTISCVQKTEKNNVIYTADISKMDSIKKSRYSWRKQHTLVAERLSYERNFKRQFISGHDFKRNG